MSFYYVKDTDDCNKDYTSIEVDEECNKVKGYLGLESSSDCSNICKVDLSEMIKGLENKEYNDSINQLIREIDNFMNFENPKLVSARQKAEEASTKKQEEEEEVGRAKERVEQLSLSKTDNIEQPFLDNADQEVRDAEEALIEALEHERIKKEEERELEEAEEAKIKKELVYKYQRLYDLIFELKKKDEITDTDKKILQKIIDFIEDKVTKYLDGNIYMKLKEEKFKLIIENNHLKKEIDAITLRSQEYLQDIEEDNKFKKGQDIIRDRIEFYNKWLHGLKKTTLIVHFILVFIVIGMIVYKLS